MTASDLSFHAPARLWLLVLLVLPGAVAVVHARRARTPGNAYAEPALAASAAPARPRWRRPLATLGLALATVALTGAFAQPQVTLDQHKRAVVVVALDTSTSMRVDDVSPDRITVAKATAKTFIGDLPDTVDVALVAYSRVARLVTAPTADHASAAAAIDALSLDGGTAMGDALQTSLRAVATSAVAGGTSPAARIVLLSDGGNTTGSPLAAAITAATDARVPVSTIAFGSADGIGTVDGGRQVQAPVDYAALKQIADATGGTAYRAAGAEELRSVYQDIGTQLVTAPTRRDVSDLFAGAGLALLFLTAVPSLLWFSRLV